MATSTVDTVLADGLRLAYRELGSGAPVLLLHGWPTSSHLWRNVMPAIAGANRVVALDLPGFGASDKPLGVRYNFEFYARILDGFLTAIGVDEVAIAGHDLGGPIALHWALSRPGRVAGLALLNTVVYPEFSPSVIEFVTACRTPELRERLTSPEGLTALMRTGVADPSHLTDDVVAAVCAPFTDSASRQALAAAGSGLERQGFIDLARRLPSLRVPLRIIYGQRDRILPDIADTVARLRRDLSTAEVTALGHCGHFLQEDAPQVVGDLLATWVRTTSG